MNRAEKAVSKVDKRLGKIFEAINKDLFKFDLLNASPEETQARIKGAVDKQAEAISAVLDSTIGTAIGVSPLADVVRAKYTTGALSQLYDRKGITKLITDSVERSISTYRNYGQAARELRGVMTKAVDPYKAVAKLQKSARAVLAKASTDAEKKSAFNVIAKTKKLLARDDLTKLMGKKLGDETLSGLPKQLRATLDKAVREDAKMRSMRIVRTEYAKAYGDTQLSEAATDERVIAVQFSLNSSHDIYDICNFHTELDAYGLGAGIYPTDKQPEYPFHPNCIVEGSKVFFNGCISAATKAHYSGNIVKVSTRDGNTLSVTENHPIMTNRGWVYAKHIVHGDKVISGKRSKGMVFGINPNNDKRNPAIEDVFTTLKESVVMNTVTMPVTAEDFHGDARFFNENIDIVYTNSFLLNTFNAIAHKIIKKNVLNSGNIISFFLNCLSMLKFRLNCFFRASHRIMSRFCDSFASFFGVEKFIKSIKRLFDISNLDTSFFDPISDTLSANTKNVSDGLNRLASFVFFDDVVNVENEFVHTYVYDLQVEDNEIYITNGVLVKNCMCAVDPVYIGEIDPKNEKNFDRKEGQKFLNDLPQNRREELLGVTGNKLFEDGAKWEDVLQNYRGQTDFVPVGDTIEKQNTKNVSSVTSTPSVPVSLVDEFENMKIIPDTHEEMLAVNGDGEKIFSKIGGSKKVSFSTDEVQLIRSHKDVILTHTHPFVASLSDADVYFAAKNNLAQIRAVDQKYTYILERPKEGWSSAKDMGKSWKLSLASQARVFNPLLRQKLITIQEVNEKATHTVMERLSKKYEVKYERIPRQQP